MACIITGLQQNNPSTPSIPTILAVLTSQEISTPTIPIIQKDIKQRLKELGFFDPQLNKSYKPEDIAIIRKDLYY